ncbi:MAG: VOC family protein [Bacteroidetes bacterium]|nr:VOC family protein [Bacteroidota bacterium]
MASLNPYLNFNGNCKEAMTHYHHIIGGDFQLQTFGDAPMDSPPELKDQVMHASIVSDKITIMASDAQPGQPATFGSAIWLNINCDSGDQQNHLWNGLSDGGTVVMELQDTFWGARFGMFIDKFGIGWMLNFESAGQNSEGYMH